MFFRHLNDKLLCFLDIQITNYYVFNLVICHEMGFHYKQQVNLITFLE